LNTDDGGRAASPRPRLYRRAYDLAVKALADASLGETGSDSARVMRRLVAEVEAELSDHAEARDAIEEGVCDAVMGRQPSC
jgi:hypothetical protein